MGIRLNQTLEDGVYNWATTALPSNVTVIWDKPGEPRPDKPYLVLNFPSGPVKTDGPDQEYKQTDTWTYTWRKRIILSVGIIADEDYLKYMSMLLNSLDYEPYYLELQKVGFACWGYNGPWDVSELIDSQFEFRANADIVLSYGEDIDYAPGEIHSVKVNDRIIDINA
jgi:hypothetical protein